MPLAIARHYGAKFYLAHVVSHVGYTIAGPEALKLATEKTQREARQLEQELVKSGALAGLDHDFIVGEGNVWEQLELVIRQKQVDVVVIGTHGRGGLGKLLLGSVAEQIFRHADCFVVTVGPGSYEDSLVEKTDAVRPFLFVCHGFRSGFPPCFAACHLLRKSFRSKTRCAPHSPCGPDTGRISLVHHRRS